MVHSGKANAFKIPTKECQTQLRKLILEVGKSFLVYVAMVIMCYGSHYFLKPHSQPRIVTDIVVGLIVGNISFVRELLMKYYMTLAYITDFGMMCYMFALGIEMDPYLLLKRPTRTVKISYAGVIITFLFAVNAIPFAQYFPKRDRLLEVISACSILLASTDSAVLTRLITQLKIGKSDIGKLVIAVGMHSDFVCSLTLSIGYIFVPLPQVCDNLKTRIPPEDVFKMGCAVLVQVAFTLAVAPFLMKWVDNENPEGRAMKGPHLVLSIAYIALTIAIPPMWKYSPLLSAFLTGVCFPRQSRVSKWVITKINYLLNTIFFPIFFLWMGIVADLRKFEPLYYQTWMRLFVIMVISISGKVLGTIVSGRMLGYQRPELVSIGLLLTTKGHLHIYLALKVMGCGEAIRTTTGIVMILSIFLTDVYTPIVVAEIIRRAKKRAPTHRMALQSLDPSSELRILLCVHGPHNVPASINLMEISKGTADPGILVYVTDLIEVTDEIDTLEREEGMHTATIQDKEVNDMIEQITNSFQTHMQENGEGITLKRTMALSTINNMPRDICVLAEDLMVSLIILPFHRSRREDGILDGGNQGFRYVNRKVLRSSPCSIGILVDRGLGSFECLSRCQVTLNVAVIFIGGKDDREALAYAGLVAQHPGVKLTVIRFLVDSSTESSRLVGYRIILPEQEEEMKLDDECFAHFYEKHVIGGRISYTEKHLANAAETFSILRSFEGQYSLVIVGREGGVNSILTRGMNDWQQCPELGPIGDVLSGPDFAMTVSVLIIQQHVIKGEIDGLDDEFSVMSYKY